MFKIKCLNSIAQSGLSKFNGKFKIVADMPEAHGILLRSHDLHNIDFPPNLEAIARAGAGVNNIPVERCTEAGIVVFNTPGANANGVKELVIAGMLIASRNIIAGINFVTEHCNREDLAKFVEKEKARFAGSEIQGKKLGVIGLGSIGVLVANAGWNMNMEVYGYDPFISVDHAWRLSRHIIHVNSINDIYSVCDYISIHVPLSDETRHMINKEAFKKMKAGVILLNFARDALVCDADLAAALASGQVKKYVTDFPNYRTANLEKVIAIPHLGASTAEAEDNCAQMAVRQLIDYFENGNITNSVNFPECDAGICQAAGRITLYHKNIPNMINQFTGVFFRENINIANMYNRSRGEYAYSLFDIDSPTGLSLKKNLLAIPGVIKVKIIK
ncbi:MAG: phosphoglycerate dehydrogenase [Bacilli bacterium]|nr:phosphoglycerate dehydrogenase [Bacilli bacterium]